MKKMISMVAVLCVAGITSACSAEDMTLEEAVKTWSFMKGTWTVTLPDGTIDQSRGRLSPAKNAIISESDKALHVFGWDPKTKMLEIQSFMGDGARGRTLCEKSAENVITCKEGYMISAEGDETQFESEAKFTIVDANTYKFTMDNQTWTLKRKVRTAGKDKK
jgi:hypothetical protein